MARSNAEEIVGSLDDVLELERAALLKGDVDKINRLADRKEDLMSKIGALQDVPESLLTPLKAKLHRNRDLIEHALEGIRAAADRMNDMKRARDGLQTYDRNGKLSDLPSPAKRSVEKRA